MNNNMTTDTCSICLNVFEDNKNKMYLECGHQFHCSCIFEMFTHNTKKCPNCRHNISYEVPENQLQERITRLEDENIQNLNELSLIFSEYEMLTELHVRLKTVEIMNQIKNEL